MEKKIKYPKNCDPNRNPFDLLSHLEFRAENLPQPRGVAEKAPVPKVQYLHHLPFAGLTNLVKV